MVGEGFLEVGRYGGTIQVRRRTGEGEEALGEGVAGGFLWGGLCSWTAFPRVWRGLAAPWALDFIV